MQTILQDLYVHIHAIHIDECTSCLALIFTIHVSIYLCISEVILIKIHKQIYFSTAFLP